MIFGVWQPDKQEQNGQLLIGPSIGALLNSDNEQIDPAHAGVLGKDNLLKMPRLGIERGKCQMVRPVRRRTFMPSGSTTPLAYGRRS